MLDLSDLLSKIDFKIISVVVDKEFLKLRYPNPVDPYHYSLTMLIEILIPFLIGVNGICKVSAESRNGSNFDIPLQSHFKQIFDVGTRWGHYGDIKLENIKIQSTISSKNIKFFNKKSIIENKIHGLEISDLLCNSMMQVIKSAIYRENKINRPQFIKPQIPIFTQKTVIEKICKGRTIGINWQP